jgi:phosphohistidine phosphatase SixA
VILLRHAITMPGVGDLAGMRLDDCSTQRNLTDEGRCHAGRVGGAFRACGVTVDRVLSSPWRRCQETARLAFGEAERWSASVGAAGTSLSPAASPCPEVRAPAARRVMQSRRSSVIVPQLSRPRLLQGGRCP